MAEYFLNNKSLSDFGIVPSRNAGSIAITGGFDLPKRNGNSFYNWPLEDSVEPFVNAEDISFGEREIKFIGTILGNINSNIQVLEKYIYSLPELFTFSCKWGTWNVRIRKQIVITPIDRDNSTITITFTEPLPNLSGTLPTPSGKNDIDTFSWSDFGLWLKSISGSQDIAVLKNLNVTQNQSELRPSTGGREKTEITTKASLICSDFGDFKQKVKHLYAIIGGAGLRKIRYRGVEYTCFAADGFNISNIIIQEKVFADFQCKFIVVDKNGIIQNISE